MSEIKIRFVNNEELSELSNDPGFTKKVTTKFPVHKDQVGMVGGVHIVLKNDYKKGKK